MSAAPANAIKKGSARKRLSGGASMMILFSTTIFLSAALLFLVEPMFAKFVLPTFGGTPAVWTGSMMFFQAALLTSYLYVHASTSWLGARRQAIVHLIVVLLPLLVLPLAVPAGDWAPPAEGNPLLYLLGLLFVAVGLPFFAISATNPLIQRWLAETDHPAARDPYFLYRASNLGSVIGLLGYPLVVEPSLRLMNQGIVWTIGYGVLVVLVFASAVVLWRSPAPPATSSSATAVEDEAGPVTGGSSALEASQGGAASGGLTSSPTLLRRLRWIGLAFVPSSMMLGVTSYITTDVTPIPLLWVIPLSLYLFSFVIVFSPGQRMPEAVHKVMVAALPLVIAVLVVTMLAGVRSLPFWTLILLHLVSFFVVAMVLHGELARDRPPARHLTEFYLWVAVGGVLGGVFNALVAPMVFHSVVEYWIAIVLACLFLPGAFLRRVVQGGERRGEEPQRDSNTVRWVLDLALPLVLGVAMYELGWVVDNVIDQDYSSYVWQVLIGLAAGLCLLWFAYLANRPIRFGLGLAALIVAVSLANGATALYEDRSFFGVYKITEDTTSLGTEENPYHALVVGDTNHGAEIMGQTPPVPVAYHDPTGPFGQLFSGILPGEATNSPIAVLGLGTGAMACYTQPGQQMTFYEIDPLIQQIASDPSLFTYLRDCRGDFNVVLGDGRLKLAEAPDAKYGMIVGEAFSSDAIPVHLLTREAIDLYLSKLASGGVMVFNVANRHLNLQPVLGNVAQDEGLVCYDQFDPNAEGIPTKLASEYVVMARDRADLGSLPDDQRWHPCSTTSDPSSDVWTDNFSNLLSTFNWR